MTIQTDQALWKRTFLILVELISGFILTDDIFPCLLHAALIILLCTFAASTSINVYLRYSLGHLCIRIFFHFNGLRGFLACIHDGVLLCFVGFPTEFDCILSEHVWKNVGTMTCTLRFIFI